MSYADHIFINMCKDIIENGTSTEGERVRPKWEDGTSAYTIKQFGVVNRYDLSQGISGIDPAAERRLRAVQMRCSGSGSRNLTISMIFTVMCGTNGRMRPVPSEKHMDIRWA